MELFEQRPIERPKVTPHEAEKLKGEVIRQVYANKEHHYAVVKIKSEYGDEISCVGALEDLLSGQAVELEGSWEMHPSHGRQFKVKSFRSMLPVTEEGIISFLSSGMVKGLGPKLAERIVDKFGTKTLEILDNYSARLREVPGLGRKKIAEIKEAWEDRSDRREHAMFLQGLGISPAYSQKIIKHFGSSSGEVVRQNPYRLTEVSGIGFVMADRIALSMDTQLDSPDRVTEGIIYALKKQSEKGHVYVPYVELREFTAELLRISAERFDKCFPEALKSGRVILDRANCQEGEARVYTRGLFQAEEDLAEKVSFLINALSRKIQKKGEIEVSNKLSATQQEAVRNVFKNRISIITGGPGVGKTTVVGEVVQQAQKQKMSIELAAPTGRAAKRMSESCKRAAKTIHRLLVWDPGKGSFVHDEERPLKCDLLVVDEVSMLDVYLANSLFKAISSRTTVVLVGDRDQLPSVGPGAVLHDLIHSGRISVTHLSEVFRQKEGSHIIENAHRVNRTQLPSTARPAPDQLTDFYWIEQAELDKVVDNIVEMVKNRIPTRFKVDPMHDIQVLVPMNRGNCGTERLNTVLQNALNAPASNKPELKVGERLFRLHDKEMQRRNNYDKNVFNGDMGRIIRVDEKSRCFTVKFEENTVDFEYSEADQISLAYAITIHKSQGSEFPVVIMPVLYQHYIMLQKNLIYTGMTRAKKLLVMMGDKRALGHGVRNVDQAARYSYLMDRICRY